MDTSVWQRLHSLESRDVVSHWFQKLHKNELSARRAKEIVASARQAREFFKNASNASYAVRPLLAFYGVASQSRALALLFRKNGGEEGLAKGHGLETVSWSEQLSGDLGQAVASIGGLRVRTCRGLFFDLVSESHNRMAMHIRSSAVDWGIEYDIPELGQELSLSDILDRLPDLHDQYAHVKWETRYARVNDAEYNPESGASIKINTGKFSAIKAELSAAGYSVTESGDMSIVKINACLFEQNLPQFMHSYVHKSFGAVPDLHMVSQFSPTTRYSQVAVTYILAYFTGMLTRYYPTQWTALMLGEKGDVLWPCMNAAQRYVEIAFPELVLELIEEALKSAEIDAS